MQLISGSNKPLFVPLANPPIWPESCWLETPSWACVQFLESRVPPSPFLSRHSDNSQKSEGLYFLKQVAPFSVSAMALAQWPSK